MSGSWGKNFSRESYFAGMSWHSGKIAAFCGKTSWPFPVIIRISKNTTTTVKPAENPEARPVIRRPAPKGPPSSSHVTLCYQVGCARAISPDHRHDSERKAVKHQAPLYYKPDIPFSTFLLFSLEHVFGSAAIPLLQSNVYDVTTIPSAQHAPSHLSYTHTHTHRESRR